MKKLISILLLSSFTGLIISQDALLAKEIRVQQYTLALLPLEAGARMSEADALRLTRQLHAELEKFNIFIMSDLASTVRVLQNANLSAAGCGTPECAVQAGQLLRTRLIANGNVKKVGPLFFIEVRIVHVASGQIVQSLDDEFEGSLNDFVKYMRVVAGKLVGMQPGTVSAVGAPQKAEPLAKEKTDTLNSNELLLPLETKENEAKTPAQKIKSNKGGKKWALLGLLVAGGVGAGVILSQKSDNKSSGGEGNGSGATTPLPAPPTFP